MAHSSQQQRNLSLTEELERLEQSITLTLQEIDHNFSRAHRIVTTTILPLIEQYGEQSRNVWDASKFWKQFFEASANVSLSGYEELASDEQAKEAATGEGDTTVHDDDDENEVASQEHSHADTTADLTAQSDSPNNTITSATHIAQNIDDSLLSTGDNDEDEGSVSGSTPHPPATETFAICPHSANLGSPYENLKRELRNEARGHNPHDNDDDDDNDTELHIPDITIARLPKMSVSNHSPIHPARAEQADAARKAAQDPLLHRVLDKTYRVMATPHKGAGGASGMSPTKWKIDRRDYGRGGKGGGERERPMWEDSPVSSPEMAVPKLRSEAFMSPARAVRAARTHAAMLEAPRTPGVSVHTPAAARNRTRHIFGLGVAPAPGLGYGKGKETEKEKDTEKTKGKDDTRKKKRERGEITWESDSDEEAMFADMSPPKTIQFALPPLKLLQTPAREASKRIVDDILLNAGAEPSASDEYSPTMVKMNPELLDDSF